MDEQGKGGQEESNVTGMAKSTILQLMRMKLTQDAFALCERNQELCHNRALFLSKGNRELSPARTDAVTFS